MDFKITTREIPQHHFDRGEKMYFPFEKLELKQGFDVPLELKSRVNYQLNAKKVGINKVQSERLYRMFKSDIDKHFQVIRVK